VLCDYREAYSDGEPAGPWKKNRAAVADGSRPLADTQPMLQDCRKRSRVRAHEHQLLAILERAAGDDRGSSAEDSECNT
jgi:hypothetical protein